MSPPEHSTTPAPDPNANGANGAAATNGTGAAANGAADATKTIERLERRLERAREQNEILEHMIEEKTRSLYMAQRDLHQGKVFLENVLGSMTSAVFVTDECGTISSVGGSATSMSDRSEAELVGTLLDDVMTHPGDGDEATLHLPDGSAVPVLMRSSELMDEGESARAVHVATDISERKRLEVELRHAQRLESIGQLAAGVAHEINTPIQYVSDSARFLAEVIEDLLGLDDHYEPLRSATAEDADYAPQVKAAIEYRDEIDVDFIRTEAPGAVARTIDGLERVASIVKALKQFSHPGSDTPAPVELNEVVDNALTVARSEYKLVADVEFIPGEIPEVLAFRGDLSQVLVNLVVNAAHAIADHNANADPTGSTPKGRIDITTSATGDGVAVVVTDSGGGIPATIRERVFEPFFTTKEPGRGTGQGLALAHNVVVGKHAGRLTFEVDEGVGTTFTMWLPLVSPDPEDDGA
ncbi:MAG: ATP-binding protein [Actinomycetota bacterium]